MDKSFISLLIFIFSYILFILAPRKKMFVSVCAGITLLALGILSFKEALFVINWNVMGIFVGMLIIADIFMESRLPAYLAEVIVDKAKNTAWALLSICLLSSFISAFVENVATVLIVAPVAIALAKKLKINPVNVMIAIAISSNLQGTATLIGDPPSMLLGGFAKMNFMDFFFYNGKPSIFFAVEFGAIASFFVLYFVFRQHKEKTQFIPVEKVKSWVPGVILLGLILALAALSFFGKGFSELSGAICMLGAFVSLAWEKAAYKNSLIKRIKSLDWNTTLFLVGVFVLVGSITATGWINKAADLLSTLVGGNVFLGYTIIVLLSVFLSAFIDNVPYLVAMLPVVISMSSKLQISPYLFLFGLLIGASLGGNITPIGASANIVACGILKKEGYEVNFKNFVKIGLPFTLAAVIAASSLVWFIWKP